MRSQTLAGICVFLAIGIGCGLWLLGLSLPRGVSPLAVSLVLVPVFMVILIPLNNRLLKSRERDLEIEKRHENEDAGVISLRAREKRPEDDIRFFDSRPR